MRHLAACAECGRDAFHTKPGDGGTRVCTTCFAFRHHWSCPECGQQRPPWRRPVGTPCGLCVTRAEGRATMDAYRDTIVVAVIDIDGDLAAGSVANLVERLTPNREQRRLLAASVSSDPAWFSGSVLAPVVAERLIAGLAILGSSRFAPPACGACARPTHCVGRAEDGTRLCKRCDHARRTADCGQCGRHRPLDRRLSDGRRVCSSCARSERERLERCGDCGQDGIVHHRKTGGGSICPRCYMRRARALQIPSLTGRCLDCGREGFCIGVSSGEPRCRRCYPKRKAPCAGCGRTMTVAVVWAAGPHCHRCRQLALDARSVCQGCGQVRRIDPRDPDTRQLCSDCAGLEPLSRCATCGIEARLWDRRRCPRCTLDRRLHVLFGSAPVDTARRLEPLRAILDADPNARGTLDWLTRRGAGAILARVLDGSVELTHDGLDQVGAKGADHLRYLLVSADILAARDEELASLERWIAGQLKAVRNVEDRQVAEMFAVWHVLRRRRQRAATRGGGTGDTTSARRSIGAAIELLAWLRQRGRPLPEMTQADADLWIASGSTSRRSARAFLSWAARRRAAPDVKVTVRPRQLPTPSLTIAQLEDFIRRLVTDESLPTADRVAGLLVALYGQTATRLVRLTIEDLEMRGDRVALRLGRNAVDLPPLLAHLVAELAAGGRGRGPRSGAANGPWLFPGGNPGRPLSADWLASRIARHGLPVAALRTHALLELAAELPAAVIADLVGVCPDTAVRWGQVAGGEWASYAAARSRSAQ